MRALNILSGSAFCILYVSLAVAADASSPMGFTSVKVDLPWGDRSFSGGHEADAINANCLACHSAGMVLTQPHLTKAEWEATVHKMIRTYHAPVDEKDVPAIIDYLTAMKLQP